MAEEMQVARVRVRPIPVDVVVDTQPRVRTREAPTGVPKMPSRWPSGSAIYWQGTCPRMGAGIAEQQPGFLGRIFRSGDKMHAWKWRPTGYFFLGEYATFQQACDKIG